MNYIYIISSNGLFAFATLVGSASVFVLVEARTFRLSLPSSLHILLSIFIFLYNDIIEISIITIINNTIMVTAAMIILCFLCCLSLSSSAVICSCKLFRSTASLAQFLKLYCMPLLSGNCRLLAPLILFNLIKFIFNVIVGKRSMTVFDLNRLVESNMLFFVQILYLELIFIFPVLFSLTLIS